MLQLIPLLMTLNFKPSHSTPLPHNLPRLTWQPQDPADQGQRQGIPRSLPSAASAASWHPSWHSQDPEIHHPLGFRDTQRPQGLGFKAESRDAGSPREPSPRGVTRETAADETPKPESLALGRHRGLKGHSMGAEGARGSRKGAGAGAGPRRRAKALVGFLAKAAVVTPWGHKADLVVDQSGHGDYTSLKAAIAAAPMLNSRPFVIYIKQGQYETYVQFSNSNITLVGDGADKTVLFGGSHTIAKGSTLTSSANIVVFGNAFAAMGITFYNTATSSQALAIYVSSDKSVFWNCVFKGYQDTLYATSGRQLYQNCTIIGLVDFIFGETAAVFQKCTIHILYDKVRPVGVIMASGRASATAATGLVFVNGRIQGDPGAQVCLGRPWKQYSRMVYINTYMTDVVAAEGWMTWNGGTWNNLPYYGEYGSQGPGANGNRVTWAKPGQSMSWQAAQAFLPDPFIGASSWVSSTAMPPAFFTDFKS